MHAHTHTKHMRAHTHTHTHAHTHIYTQTRARAHTHTHTHTRTHARTHTHTHTHTRTHTHAHSHTHIHTHITHAPTIYTAGNVNGLRPVVSKFGGLSNLLNNLNAGALLAAVPGGNGLFFYRHQITSFSFNVQTLCASKSTNCAKG